MKALFILTSIVLFSCKSSLPPKSSSDVLSGLIQVHKRGKLDELISIFGKPNSIEKTQEDGVEKYIYKSTERSFVTFVRPSTAEVLESSTLLWKSEDDYEWMKKRFGQYHWIEKPLKTTPHPLREMYEVHIPEIGVSFEYDRLAPKITWVFFRSLILIKRQ